MRYDRSPKMLVFIAVVSTVIFGLLIRLVDLQLVQGDSFLMRADANRFFSERIPPERGVILDRYGQALVMNTPEYYRITDTQALYSEYQPLDTEAALHLLATDSAQVAYQLRRKYLYPEATAHVLGYVGSVTAEDLARNQQLHTTDLIGKLGLERIYDEQLRGAAGQILFEVDALGKRRRRVGEQPQVPGQSLLTTLDPYLSQVALEALGDQKGAVVIMDAETGAVLSLVSTPSYDSNIMSARYLNESAERERLNMVQQLISHPLKLFFNRAVSGTYPPGSVFKLVTAIAGLETDSLSAETEVIDDGTLEVGEYTYANWYYTQLGGVEGAISLQRALARSNDIYFYKAAEWVGPTKLAEMARLFGLGKKTGIALTGEAAGLVPDPAWKEQHFGEAWFLGNTFHFGIGQDNLLVTPLQVAGMAQAVANHGTQCAPRLLQHSTVECSELGIAEDDLEVVLQGMLDACSSGGTGFPFFPHNEVYRAADMDANAEVSRGAVACKTGTAEFGAVDEQGYKSTHGWFIATTGVNFDKLGVSLAEDTVNGLEVATQSAAVAATGSASLREKWLTQVATNKNFPKKLVFAVLVESDELQPYKEGSRDAAPVIKAVVDWMYGE